jgi:type IV pilus assembly protein PilE
MNSPCRSCSCTLGHSLIECLLVVALGAIFAASALPTQTHITQRMQRMQARSALAQASWWMERQASLKGNYPASIPDSVWYQDGLNYTLTLSLNNGGYALKATPIGGQSGDPCGALGLNNLGQRSAQGDLSTCW